MSKTMPHSTYCSLNIKAATEISGRLSRFAGILFWFSMGSLISWPLLAADSESVPAHIFSIGVIAHDHGPFSDHNEDGTDLNLEVQFAPLDVYKRQIRILLRPTSFSIRAGALVKLTGKLVNVHRSDGFYCNSSLTRNDSGAGARELIYVEDVQMG